MEYFFVFSVHCCWCHMVMVTLIVCRFVCVCPRSGCAPVPAVVNGQRWRLLGLRVFPARSALLRSRGWGRRRGRAVQHRIFIGVRRQDPAAQHTPQAAVGPQVRRSCNYYMYIFCDFRFFFFFPTFCFVLTCLLCRDVWKNCVSSSDETKNRFSMFFFPPPLCFCFGCSVVSYVWKNFGAYLTPPPPPFSTTVGTPN